MRLFQLLILTLCHVVGKNDHIFSHLSDKTEEGKHTQQSKHPDLYSHSLVIGVVLASLFLNDSVRAEQRGGVRSRSIQEGAVLRWARLSAQQSQLLSAIGWNNWEVFFLMQMCVAFRYYRRGNVTVKGKNPKHCEKL